MELILPLTLKFFSRGASVKFFGETTLVKFFLGSAHVKVVIMHAVPILRYFPVQIPAQSSRVSSKILNWKGIGLDGLYLKYALRLVFLYIFRCF